MSIEVDSLDFSYGNFPVLNKITFQTRPAEKIAIVGPNGTGKSTLIKCINGLLKPRRGEVRVGGMNVHRMKPVDLSRRLGYVPQSAGGGFPLTVFDMVMLGRRPHASWRSGRQDRIKVLKTLELMQVDHLALKNYNELSGGQQQKVIIARAIAQETDHLLLDEATSNLDIRHQLEVIEIIVRLSRERGITALMIVHDLNIAARFADRIIMMKQNRVAAVGTPAEVLTEKNISRVYEVRTTIRQERNRPYVVLLDPVGKSEPGDA